MSLLQRKERNRDFFCVCVKDNARAGRSFGPIVRDIYLLECCYQGKGSVIINGTEFPVKPGDCYVLLPGDKIIHTADAQNPRRGYSCAFDGALIGRAFSVAGMTAQKPFAPPEVFQKILRQMEKLEQLRYATDIGAEYKRMAGLYEILGILTRNAQEKEYDAWTNRVVCLMEAWYNEPITVQWLADQMGLERCYFSTVFKEKTGRTPLEYLNAIRIEKACILLKETDASALSVAESVGLGGKNFYRVFKKLTGKTPREYKEEK